MKVSKKQYCFFLCGCILEFCIRMYVANDDRRGGQVDD